MKHTAAFADYGALSAHLGGLGLFCVKMGLGRMRGVLKRLCLVRPPFFLVQVVGTNGKGSVSTMLDSLAREHGLRTGLHTSPHFVSVRERIRVNGALLAEEEWTELGNRLMAHGGGALTYFEFVTALAVLAFERAGVDLAVMETGLGGRYDATTALEADLVLFTPIGLDHQAVLGQDLAAIASDKAFALRPGKPALSAAQAPEVLRELRYRAQRRGAHLRLIDGADAFFGTRPRKGAGADKARAGKEGGGADGSGPAGRNREGPRQSEPLLAEPLLPGSGGLGLAGPHQEDNARLALAAWRLLARDIPPPPAGEKPEPAPSGPADAREAAALQKAWLPGRLHFIPPGIASGPFAACPSGRPPLLLDGAHNAHGLAALGKALAKQGVAPSAVVFSCLADKDPEVLIPLLRALATGPIFVPPIQDNDRACDPARLAAAIGLNARPAASLAEALGLAARHMAERFPEALEQTEARNPLLICGSLYLLGEFYALFPEFLEAEAHSLPR